ncbi:MAG: hypothetical protein K9M10_00790 [Candidatus Pacebacteria bacterium]|nr:hypothetical protein [Candidatus Paceibacterota bacterium]MCF7856999.1 hypothetical protein [Candidatus Paceibacterota bacterium]
MTKLTWRRYWWSVMIVALLAFIAGIDSSPKVRALAKGYYQLVIDLKGDFAGAVKARTSPNSEFEKTVVMKTKPRESPPKLEESLEGLTPEPASKKAESEKVVVLPSKAEPLPTKVKKEKKQANKPAKESSSRKPAVVCRDVDVGPSKADAILGIPPRSVCSNS